MPPASAGAVEGACDYKGSRGTNGTRAWPGADRKFRSSLPAPCEALASTSESEAETALAPLSPNVHSLALQSQPSFTPRRPAARHAPACRAGAAEPSVRAAPAPRATAVAAKSSRSAPASRAPWQRSPAHRLPRCLRPRSCPGGAPPIPRGEPRRPRPPNAAATRPMRAARRRGARTRRGAAAPRPSPRAGRARRPGWAPATAATPRRAAGRPGGGGTGTGR